MILDTPLKSQGSDYTIRTLFKDILDALIDEADSFSGKRPLGDSGWQGEIAADLIDQSILEGEVTRDRDGDIEEVFFDFKDFDAVMHMAIEEL